MLAIFATSALTIFSMMDMVNASSNREEKIESALISLGARTVPSNVTSQLSSLLPEEFVLSVLNTDEIDNRLELALRLWQIVAPEWREVPQSLMIQVRQCRDEALRSQQSSTTTSPSETGICDQHLRIQLRFQHAERLTNRLTERIADAERLPEPLRTQALQTLEMIRERVETRLQEMSRLSQNTVDEALEPLGENQQTLNQVRTRLEQQTRQTTSSSTSVQPNETSNTQQGAKK